ncbi:MAG: polysaccharide biosynthesis tyrosine autokinase [Planctomycetota bacterium]
MDESMMPPAGAPGRDIQRVDVSYLGEGTEGAEGGMEIVQVLARKWKLAALVALLVCAVGLPMIWFLVKPLYTATSAIEIAPVIPRIVFEDEAGPVPFYSNFMNTQAALIMSTRVLYPLLEEPVVRNLEYLKKAENPLDELRERMRAAEQRGSQLLLVSMTAEDPKAAAEIVNAAVRVYMRIEGGTEATSEDEKLRTLERERDSASEKLRGLYETMHQLAQEFGSSDYQGRQDVMLARVQGLQEQLTQVETARIAIEAQLAMFEEETAERPAESRPAGSQPAESRPAESRPTTREAGVARLRREYINADPLVSALMNRIVEIEQSYDLVALRWQSEDVPELVRMRESLSTIRRKLDESREKAGREFDAFMEEEALVKREQTRAAVEERLRMLQSQEEHIRNLLEQQNEDAVTLGRKGLAIKKLEDEIALTRDLHQTLAQRIQVLRVERQRPARVRVAYEAEAPREPSRDKRSKYSVVLAIGAALFGGVFVVLANQMNRRIERPSDVEAQRGLRVLGTTPKFRQVGEEEEHRAALEDDYRTIRVNLMLSAGKKRGHVMAIGSPQGSDGKTTFAINLATSIAMTGKRVLLVDGDMRKPDVGRYLRLDSSRGLPQVLAGECELKDALQRTMVTTLEVLPSNRSGHYQTELLAGEKLPEMITQLREQYDEIVIDTPAILGLPDAKLWARLADTVVLVARSEKTSARDLAEARVRMEQVGVKISGVVLTDVRSRDSYQKYYHRYGRGWTEEPPAREGGEGDGGLLFRRGGEEREEGEQKGKEGA